MEDVGAGIQPFHGVDDQVEMVELRSHGIEEIGGHAASGAVEHGGELRQRDRRMRKLAAGTAPQDDLLDRVARNFRVR